MTQVCLIFVFVIAVTMAGNLTEENRDAKEGKKDRKFELLPVRNGELRRKTHHLQKKSPPGAAAVAAGATVLLAAQDALAKIGSYDPKIVISIINEGPHTWEGLNVYFDYGTSDEVVPHRVPKGDGFNFGARQTKSAMSGAAGVIALYSPEDDKTIYVLYSVPYNQNLYSNWWNVQVRDGNKDAEESIYDDLYNKAKPGDAKRYVVNVGEGYSCNAVMSDSSQGKLEVRVVKKLRGDIGHVIDAIPVVLEEIGDYDPKISIGIINDGPYKWESLNTYFTSGTSDIQLPDTVLKHQGLNFGARKTSSARGAVGVIALYSSEDDKTIYVHYSVPYDQTLYSNEWNVLVRDGKKDADSGVYLPLRHNVIKGNGKRCTKDLDYDYSYSGVMSKSSKATLEVHIKKKLHNVGK